METVVIIGNGGHAKVIIDMFCEAGSYEVVGCTGKDVGTGHVLGVPVLGDDSVLHRLRSEGVRYVFVALGDNRARKLKSREVIEAGFEFVNCVSSRAIISRNATLGQGVAVMPGAVVNASAQIGDGAIVNTGATVDHDNFIGDFAHIAPGSNLAGRVQVGEGAFLGTGVRVIPEIKIGAWSVIGAGAVVIHDVPPNATAYGVPAIVRNRVHAQA